MLVRGLRIFVEELLRPLVLHPPPASSMAESVNHRDGEPRRRGMPMASVEHMDMETDSFPHMPWSASVDEERLRDKKPEHPPQWRGDLGNIMLLIFLYVLQGIPLGLAGSIPMLLQSRKVSYTEQAMFSFVYWPFSIKLLWAPLVDSLYFRWFGRRKTWLIPTQYLIGLFMMVLSFRIKSIMSDENVDVMYLTVIFFMLNFLAATQDIAVDGWALTMLSRQNVGWASTCNTVGQTAGYFLGNVLFLALESANFCNNYLRWTPQPEGIVTLASFLYFWGIVFFATTTLVGLLKPESVSVGEEEQDQGIVDTYKTLLNVIKLPAVVSYTLILLTAKITFAGADALTSLKLIESGMPKERLALFAVPMVPIQIFLPLMISKYTHGPRPMDIFLKAYPYRVLLGPVYALLVYWSHNVQTTPGEFPWYFYVITLLAYGVHQVFVYMIFVAQMAFHAKISDPVIGGTYMTLLNTVANLGGNWPSTFMLWLVDHVTFKHCSVTGETCSAKGAESICKGEGNKCLTTLDGYYILTAVCLVVGIIWLAWRRNRLRQLDSLDESAWKYEQKLKTQKSKFQH